MKTVNVMKDLKELASLSSKMDHQIEKNAPFTVQAQIKNFRSVTQKLSPSKKGKLFLKTFCR